MHTENLKPQVHAKVSNENEEKKRKTTAHMHNFLYSKRSSLTGDYKS